MLITFTQDKSKDGNKLLIEDRGNARITIGIFLHNWIQYHAWIAHIKRIYQHYIVRDTDRSFKMTLKQGKYLIFTGS